MNATQPHNSELEEYKRMVQENIAALMPLFAKVIAGDFSSPIIFPSTTHEFAELYSNLETVFGKVKEHEHDDAKMEFVSIASHQLRTPLAVNRWYGSQLLSEWAEMKDTEKLSYVQKMLATNEQMIELVNAILNVSRIDLGTLAIEPEQVNIIAIAESVLTELEPAIINKSLHIKKEFDIHLPLIAADPKLMRIVFQNLFTNAVKYTAPGGSITSGIVLQGTNILITIADTGCGIPVDQQSGIFGKFFRTSQAKHIDPNGTGLGMYIVKAIVDRAGGKIWFSSEENKGTTFFVLIPLAGMQRKEGANGLTESYA